MKFIFDKKFRLLKSYEFNNMRNKSTKVENKDFYLIFKENLFDNSRIGLTVSKRIGNAVVRNRIKRIIRDYYRHNRILVSKNIDIIIIAKKYVAGKTNKEIFESLNKVFYKIDNGKNN